jgi:uncharacterized protein DUF4911
MRPHAVSISAAKLAASPQFPSHGKYDGEAKQAVKFLFQPPAGPLPAMSTITLAIPPERIALFKAIIESYDNLATLRTEDPRRHYLKLYFAPEMADEIEALLDALQAAFAIRRLP